MNQSSNFNIYNVKDVTRVEFIRKTYAHVALAVLSFVVFESFLFVSGIADSIAFTMLNNWWLILILFIGGTWIANKWAVEPGNIQKQYLGLFLFAFIEAIIFVPLFDVLFSTPQFSGQVQSILGQAGVVTGGLFTGLTATALFSKKDFSFLRSIITIGAFVALATIFAGMIFEFDLGVWFSAGMVLLASGSILYQTSRLLRDFHTTQHVAAALGLFASLMTLFWYILQIFMSRD